MKVYYEGDLSDWKSVAFYDEEGTLLHVYAAQITIVVNRPTVVELDFGRNVDPDRRERQAELIPKPGQAKSSGVCPDCKGTGEYRGFSVVEPCRTCKASEQNSR
jgi:hypothetical protein